MSEQTQEKAQEKKGQDKSQSKKAGAVPKKKAARKNISTGRCYIKSGFGNTVVTFTDGAGNAICWGSAGAQGFKGSRKGTPFAAQVAAEDASRKAVENGLKSVDVLVNGPGAGREPAIRAIAAAGIRVSLIRDETPVPHNGCRPPKRRRV
jgi:small subunit ribosomal protein S11